MFEDAYREHGAGVFGLARRLVVDRSVAEEVTQEVFLRLWRRPDRFDPTRGSLRSFLLADCYGRSIDAIRSESARRRREARVGRSDALDAATDVADDVCATDVHGNVALLIQVLPDDEREAISLAYFSHFTYQQVAVILDAPEGTVKGRIRSGLRRLRTQVVETGLTE
ncbi:MAG: sigma-70 family RNA polymerase sigma factor [Acidimicrobiales bacterium]